MNLSFLASFDLRTHLLLCILIALLSMSFQSGKYTPNPLGEDSGGYLSIAQELKETGIFTNGWYGTYTTQQGEQGQGMFFAPLYPAMLALVAKTNSVFSDTLSCHMAAMDKGKRELCSQEFGLLYGVQIMLAALSLIFLWLTAWAVSGRFALAWLAMGLAMITKTYVHYTPEIMTETLLFPLFHGASFFAALGWRKKSCSSWALAGIFLGLCALTRPAFIYVFYVSIPLFIVALFWAGQGSRRLVFICALLFSVGYGAMTAPWMVRNGTSIGTYAISNGYAPFILQQRLAFNEMSWKEWRVSFIYGLPDFGDSLAEDLFEKEDYRRFDYSTLDGFYLKGNAVFKDADALAEFAAKDRLPELMQTGIKDNLYKHVMVTLSLAWRGMWVSKYWGLVAIPVFFGVLIYALRRRWAEFLIIAFPPWFLLGLHAFTSVNVVRYNLILIPCLAIAVAFALLAGLSWVRNNKNMA